MVRSMNKLRQVGYVTKEGSKAVCSTCKDECKFHPGWQFDNKSGCAVVRHYVKRHKKKAQELQEVCQAMDRATSSSSSSTSSPQSTLRSSESASSNAIVPTASHDSFTVCRSKQHSPTSFMALPQESKVAPATKPINFSKALISMEDKPKPNHFETPPISPMFGNSQPPHVFQHQFRQPLPLVYPVFGSKDLYYWPPHSKPLVPMLMSQTLPVHVSTMQVASPVITHSSNFQTWVPAKPLEPTPLLSVFDLACMPPALERLSLEGSEYLLANAPTQEYSQCSFDSLLPSKSSSNSPSPPVNQSENVEFDELFESLCCCPD